MIDGCFDFIDIRTEIERSEGFNIQYLPLNQSIHQKYFSGITLYIIQLKLAHFKKNIFSIIFHLHKGCLSLSIY